MADEERRNRINRLINIFPWMPGYPWRRSRPQTVNLGRAEEKGTAHPAEVSLSATATLAAAPVITGSGQLEAGPATVSGVGTVIERDAEAPARSTDGNEFVPGDGGQDGAAAVARRAAAAGTRLPHLESGATEPPGNLLTEDGDNLLTEDGSNLQLEGGGNLRPVEDADVSQQSSGAARLDAVQARRHILQAFRGDKAIIIAWTDRALDNVALLEAALDGARINDPATVAELRNLVADQTAAVANIRGLVAAGATDEAIAEYDRALSRWISAAEKFLHNPTVAGTAKLIRGFIAAGVVAWLDPAVAASPTGWILTTVISGIGLDDLKALAGLNKKKTSRE